MTLRNFLDLRKKEQPQIVVVEKLVRQPRSWKTEVLRTLAVIITASAVIWGISNADTLVQSVTPQVEAKNFSAIGTVSGITDTSIVIDNAKGSNDKTQTSYTFSTDTVTKIETKDYTTLTFSDIKVGDKIVIQGVDQDGEISVLRIISYSTTAPVEVATSTDAVATTTDATSTATSTDATTTSTTTDATTSPSLIDTIKDAVSNVVDAITGTTTSTSTEEVSTTTASTTDEATTSVQVATTTEDTSSSTPTIVETIVNTVTDTVNKVVDAVTGNDSTTSPDTLPTTDTPPAPPADSPVTNS